MSLLAWLLAAVGVLFYCSGSIGLLRFPDVYTRIHALSKADNLGLGFIALGLALRAGSPGAVLRLALLWLVLTAASAVAGQLIAERAVREGLEPWQR